LLAGGGPSAGPPPACLHLGSIGAGLRVQVEAVVVAAVWRYEVGGARSAAERVLYELLSHHLPRGVLREAEPLPDFDAGLQRLALGRRRSSAPAPLCAAQGVEPAPRLLRWACTEVGPERAGEPSLEPVLLAGGARLRRLGV
jgi:hypothetical protein